MNQRRLDGVYPYQIGVAEPSVGRRSAEPDAILDPAVGRARLRRAGQGASLLLEPRNLHRGCTRRPVPLNKLLPEALEGPAIDCLPHLPHQVEIEVQVMQADQPQSE